MKKTIEITAEGIAIIPDDSHICKWVKEEKRLDHNTSMASVLQPFIQPGDWIIDVGAFIGDMTEFFANAVGPEGEVDAYEPNIIAYEALKYNMKKHRHVCCFDFALSDDNHFGTLQQHEKNYGTATINPDSKYGEVLCLPLDQITGIATEKKKIKLIKMDVEGFENRVISGALETIKQHRPYIVMEVNEGALKKQGCTPSMLLQNIIHLGYQVRNIYPGEKMDGPQYDVICIPEEKPDYLKP